MSGWVQTVKIWYDAPFKPIPWEDYFGKYLSVHSFSSLSGSQGEPVPATTGWDPGGNLDRLSIWCRAVFWLSIILFEVLPAFQHSFPFLMSYLVVSQTKFRPRSKIWRQVDYIQLCTMIMTREKSTNVEHNVSFGGKRWNRQVFFKKIWLWISVVCMMQSFVQIAPLITQKIGYIQTSLHPHTVISIIRCWIIL